VEVSSGIQEGTTIFIDVDNTALSLLSSEGLRILVDNEEIGLADDYDDVLVIDENVSEYLVSLDENRIRVEENKIRISVSIPSFSAHTISIIGFEKVAPLAPPEEDVTPPAGGIPLTAVLAVAGAILVAIVSAAVLHLRQVRGDATTELIDRGLSTMRIQEVDIFREIREHNEFTISDLMRETGASSTLARRTILKLIKKGLVAPTGEVKLPEAGRGKPSKVYKYVGEES